MRYRIAKVSWISVVTGPPPVATMSSARCHGPNFRERDGLFADEAAVLAAATSSGNDTLITIDVGNTIVLKNVALANLHTGDFHIV